jgi:MFS-type transporter involved in bile tolerance (Atg22 family)
MVRPIGSFGGAVSPAMIGAVKMHTGSLYVGLDVIAILLAIGMVTLLVCIPAVKGRQ